MDLRNRKYEIVGVSDVSLGYGSPQIPALIQSLASLYHKKALLLEPDQVDRLPLDFSYENCDVQRISQTVDPHTTAGRQEYILRTADLLNRLRPKMLVIFCTYALPVLCRLKYKPRFTLYSSLESIEAYGKFDIDLNRMLSKKINAIVFPEENRARLDSTRCDFFDIPSVILYNAVNHPHSGEMPAIEERKKRILYSGTIDYNRTLARFFLEKKTQALPIDVFGNFSGDHSEEIRSALKSVNSTVRYRGYIDAHKLSEVRKRYAYSLVMWAPDNENQLYACPNKFFDAIADGVPPITTPHPQARMLLERYRCGFVMEDWSYGSFLHSITQALSICGSDRYQRLVQNCQNAVDQELNWEAQFKKLSRILPEYLED